MLRTCQNHESTGPEKKRQQKAEANSPRKTRFTTDYDGTKIPFKKKKDDGVLSLFARTVITERVVECSRAKDRPDSAKLMDLNLASSDSQHIYNEPILSRIPLNELLGSLELAKGVTLQTAMESPPTHKVTSRCGFKTSKALVSENLCHQEAIKIKKVTMFPSSTYSIMPPTGTPLAHPEEGNLRNSKIIFPKRLR